MWRTAAELKAAHGRAHGTMDALLCHALLMYRGRFAPSPTGSLHFGSLVAALASWLGARVNNGAWIVRMEDVDREREVAGAAAGILRSLEAFGLRSDEPVVYQSERESAYAAALHALEAAGHAYRCWCSRSDLEAFGGIHPPACATAWAPRPPAWRLRVRDASIAFDDTIQGLCRQDIGREVGDFVIWRADGACAYQLAVVVDDDAQGITAIVRGADLLDSTPRQIFLQRLLGYAQPAYAHVPLVLGADGRKLSKHESALAVDAGEPMPALRAALAFLGQPQSGAATPDALLRHAVQHFELSRIARTAPMPTPFAAAQKDVC